MNERRKEFCTICRKETCYTLKKVKISQTIRDKEYEFEITTAVCSECGEEMSIPGLIDLNTQEIDAQYRKAEKILTIPDIEALMKLYCIGKEPLSLALGFGAVTVSRYLEGQVPSKEYSDIMQHALTSPSFMKKLLDKNREKLRETAYKKAYSAATQAEFLYTPISPSLKAVIVQIFDSLHEVTPLALQKLLYYIQSIHLAVYNTPLFDVPCEAWVHGPVYRNVYILFKDFKFSPIEDYRFAPLKDETEQLSAESFALVDRVIQTFGIYSAKTLEQITHKEDPWLLAREGILPDQPSDSVISLSSMKTYFKKVGKTFDINTLEGLKQYIQSML